MRWAPLLAASATAVAAVRALQPGGSNGYARATAAAASPAIVKVVGVGGAGGNAVQGMISTTQGLAVEFIAMNTDQQALYRSSATTKLSLGQKCTGGLGAGGLPSVGEAAAIESSEGIASCLAGADMVFVTAGMGGGTGTGAAPVVASIAKDLGCLTVGIVTQPFSFEGRKRSQQADEGMLKLAGCVDSLLVVCNDRLLELVPPGMKMTDAFLVADDILRQGVIGTSELIVKPGLINVDFADVRSVLQGSGSAIMGVGRGKGDSRAIDAAVAAISSPLLDCPIDGAQGVIFNIVGGRDLSLSEVNAAAEIVRARVSPDANIIVGARVDESAGKDVAVTVLATGVFSERLSQKQSESLEGGRAPAGSSSWQPPAPASADLDGGQMDESWQGRQEGGGLKEPWREHRNAEDLFSRPSKPSLGSGIARLFGGKGR